MLTFHPVEIDHDLCRTDLLYVGNFFPLKGMWWRKRKQRQGLILSIAVAWYRIMRLNQAAPGFVNEEVLITSLTRQVKDAKVILERFFDITRIGYNFNDGNKSPTQISPKRLDAAMVEAIRNIIDEVKFAPGLPPTKKNIVSSVVSVARNKSSFIRRQLKQTNREDLLPAVNWLLKQDNPVIFYYEKAGKLLARDKSVWPIKSIEMWPGWLRTALFGTVIDIENSYIQFVVASLEEKYKTNPNRLHLKYPDLLRADRDKKNFRIELCRDYLKLEPTSDNIGFIKKLLMSLANGSNVTPALLTNGGGRSEAVRIIHAANPTLLPSDLIRIGNRFNAITKQLSASKKALCFHLLGVRATRENQKKIFQLYMQWERASRYKIWNAVGQSGLHLHDGIDGIISDMSDINLAKHVEETTGLRVSVDSFKTKEEHLDAPLYSLESV